MPTHRVEIAPKHLEEAKEAAEARAYESGDPLVFADVVEKGLQLRVRAGTASWILKFNGASKSLGKLLEVKTAKQARERAQNVRAIMRRGEDPAEYLKSLAVMKDHGKAAADTESRKARADGAWTWAQLADTYEAEHIMQPKVQQNGEIKPPSEDSRKDFRRYGDTEHHKKHLSNVLVRDITAELIEEIRDLAVKTNGKNAGRKAVQWISSAMSWGQEHHRKHTGLGFQPRWWTLVSPGYKPPRRNRYLTLEQIAKVLYRAERYRDIPGRAQRKETNEAAISALWWIVLTAQRTTASMSLLSARVVDDKDASGWKIAAFPAEDMKSRRYHALPLPPRVGLLLERAKLGIERESQWAFPSLKVRRNKSELIEDIHIHDTTVNLLIRRLRGKDTVGKKRGGVDLLEGIPHFSPHDLRRSLTTILTDMKIQGAAASAVLDHSSGTPGESEFQEADITRLAYNRSQRIELKRDAMAAWTEAVFEAVEKEWQAHAPRMAAPLPPVDLATAKKIPFSSSAPWYKIMEGSNALADRRRQAEAERQAAEQAKVVAFRKPLTTGDLKRLAEAGDVEPDFLPED